MLVDSKELLYNVTIPVYWQDHLGSLLTAALDVNSALFRGLLAESSCPGNATRVVGVCTWPCAFAQESRAAVGVAEEPPSSVGEVFGEHSVLVRDMPDLGMAGNSQHPDFETSCVTEEHHLAASLGVKSEGHTSGQMACA